MRGNIDIENNIAGTMVLHPEWMQDLPIQLQPEWFTDTRLSRIVATILHMQSEGRAVDLLLLLDECKRRQYTDIDALYLSQLTTQVASTAYLYEHLQILQQAWLARKAAEVGQSLTLLANNDTPSDGKDIHQHLQEAEDALYHLSEAGMTRETMTIEADVDAAQMRIEEASKNKQPIRGVCSGFWNVDAKLLGFHPTDLLILAARPAQGKTALAISFIRLIAMNRIPVAMFSLEMGREQIINRLLMQQTGLPGEVVRQGMMNDEQQRRVQEAAAIIRQWPIYLDDTPSINLVQLRQKSRQLVRKEGVQVIFVDYLQLMAANLTNRNASRENEVASISRGLKCLAKELKVPIIALSQLNRAPEQAAEVREPRLADLRESGAIEQDADVVMMIHQPKTAVGNERMLIIAKHRNGATGDVLLHFDKPTAMFSAPQRQPQPQPQPQPQRQLNIF